MTHSYTDEHGQVILVLDLAASPDVVDLIRLQATDPDDKPDIPFPGMWSLLGGMLEPGETPAECVRRELIEEIGVDLDPDRISHVRTRSLDYGIEHTFFARVDFDIDDVVLTEGQRLGWFSETDAAATELAYADNALLAEFSPP